ncbi:MAG: hypothetical protein OHK0017_09840 [Patescibacteria group bacterium]
MPIVDDQKQKFLEYLEKRGLPKPVLGQSDASDDADSQITVFNNTLAWCVNDLVRQSKEALGSSNSSKIDEEFESQLTWKLLKDALIPTIEEYNEYDPKLVQNLNTSESLEETMLGIMLYSDTYPGFSYALTVNTLMVYFGYCISFNMQPHKDSINYYQLLIK